MTSFQVCWVQAILSEGLGMSGQPCVGLPNSSTSLYRLSAALSAASMSRFSFSGVSFGRSIVSVNRISHPCQGQPTV